MKETTLLTGRSRSLGAVLSHPPAGGLGLPPPAVLLLNAGLQHHVGPHSLYVRLARELAELGFLAVRFDFSGLGDSPARTDTASPRESHLLEAREVMDDIAARYGCTAFASLGICSGARESLSLALLDARVCGALLVNPTEHLHDNTDLELTASLLPRALRRHYLRLAFRSSFRGKVWLQALRGDFDRDLLRQAVRGLVRPSAPGAASPELHPSTRLALDRLQALRQRGVIVQHVFSEGDSAVDYFHLVLGAHASEVPYVLVRGANHTFTPLWCRDELSDIVAQWASQVLASPHLTAGR